MIAYKKSYNKIKQDKHVGLSGIIRPKIDWNLLNEA